MPKVDELQDPAPENAGLASFVPANSQAVINFHVINTTSEPTLREAWLNYMYIDKSQVKGLRGNLFLLGGLAFNIAPGTHKTYTYSYSPTRPVRILDIAAHMHAHATRMTVWKVSNGQPTQVYETYNWATPTDLHYDSVHTNNAADPATQTGGGMTGTLTVESHRIDPVGVRRQQRRNGAAHVPQRGLHRRDVHPHRNDGTGRQSHGSGRLRLRPKLVAARAASGSIEKKEGMVR